MFCASYESNVASLNICIMYRGYSRFTLRNSNVGERRGTRRVHANESDSFVAILFSPRHPSTFLFLEVNRLQTGSCSKVHSRIRRQLDIFQVPACMWTAYMQDLIWGLRRTRRFTSSTFPTPYIKGACMKFFDVPQPIGKLGNFSSPITFMQEESHNPYVGEYFGIF